MLAEGVEALRELVASEPVRRYAGRETRPGPAVDAATHVRATARGFFHPIGTCAIGRVVDGDGRVSGYENLYVADASIMPTIPRANTNLPSRRSRRGSPDRSPLLERVPENQQRDDQHSGDDADDER